MTIPPLTIGRRYDDTLKDFSKHEYKIEIPNWHPTPLNKIIGNHWAVGHRLKLQDKQMIASYSKKVPKAQGKRLVSLIIILEKGRRACDPDSQFKSLLDALVSCGLLIDDNRQWVELNPVEYRRAERKSTIIVLRDL